WVACTRAAKTAARSRVAASVAMGSMVGVLRRDDAAGRPIAPSSAPGRPVRRMYPAAVREEKCMRVILCALFMLVSGAAHAWPDRPIQIIVPFPPGGTNDVVARAIGQVFSETLGASVAVVNRDGGSG